MLVDAFFENVKRHVSEHRELQPGEEEENMVLRFEPRPPRTMWIACLYSHLPASAGSDDEDLWSFHDGDALVNGVRGLGFFFGRDLHDDQLTHRRRHAYLALTRVVVLHRAFTDP